MIFYMEYQVVREMKGYQILFNPLFHTNTVIGSHFDETKDLLTMIFFDRDHPLHKEVLDAYNWFCNRMGSAGGKLEDREFKYLSLLSKIQLTGQYWKQVLLYFVGIDPGFEIFDIHLATLFDRLYPNYRNFPPSSFVQGSFVDDFVPDFVPQCLSTEETQGTPSTPETYPQAVLERPTKRGRKHHRY